MNSILSVIIPTYNPDLKRLNQTLRGLSEQTLAPDRWELIVIDNNSSFDIAGEIDLSWHPDHRIIAESRQGLTFARLKGFSAARGSIIILVDDDNILENHYLQHTLEIFEKYPFMGAIGGKSIPRFEDAQPGWLKEFYGNLALRDLGEEIIINSWDNTYPHAAPVGAGLAIRKRTLETYVERISLGKNIVADRLGNSLSSGGDNDIVLDILKAGYQVGYFPLLSLIHMIPAERTKVVYLARLLNNMNKSWVMVLENHGINPWKKIPGWTVSLRKTKAWFTYKAWLSRVNYIRWRGACGTFDGLSEKN